MRKKKVVIQTDWILAKTGFSRAAKEYIFYLHKTGKYDIVHYCCAMGYSHGALTKTPWKSIGCLPDDQNEINRLQSDPGLAQAASYGGYFIDRIIQEEKPDIWIGAQDPWAFTQYYNKKWYKKITTVPWVTLDSLPIYPEAIEQAKNSSEYWVWSDFATKEMARMGLKNVKTLHGPVNYEKFRNLGAEAKVFLRKKYNLEGAFIIGYVFRNQLRKSVPNLIEGFSIFRRNNPQIKNTKLLLHTHWSEGWNIPSLANEYGVPQGDILTTYICNKCRNYFIHPFVGQEQNCGQCNNQKCCSTTNTGFGVTEDQLCEVYNLMDVYCHPFTSGGQEIPIQEAKYCELTTLVTNYSCGEELCYEGSGSLPLEWSEYREHGTQFRKASTYPSSIAKQLFKFYNWTDQQKKENGKKSREWCIKNYAIENIGKELERLIDSAPFTTYDFNEQEELKNPNYVVPEIADNEEYVKHLYKHILNVEVQSNDEGLKHWLNRLKENGNRKQVEDYFRQVAVQDNQKVKKVPFEEILGKDDKGRRIIFVLPESIGDVYLSTSLLPSIKSLYPDHNIYYATKREYFPVLEGNPYIYKVLEFIPQMESQIWLEGSGPHEGYFDISYLPYTATQRHLDYLRSGKDKIEYDVLAKEALSIS